MTTDTVSAAPATTRQPSASHNGSASPKQASAGPQTQAADSSTKPPRRQRVTVPESRPAAIPPAATYLGRLAAAEADCGLDR
ncbi:hypothetical protein [Streptomyces sp. NBC_01207]|uniref:hypothetical protein n=1 Tax=Streptomyces sp. NBC_01207 TaxID=2903772 RepID=UPI002E11E62E|nr:hypothetical protein OG457_39820 [Streptomyces sp. NBC_01207]